MKCTRRALALLLLLTGVLGPLSAQDKPKTDAKAPKTTLKLQITIAEQEGDKKVVILPYTLFLEAGDSGPSSPWAKLRMGSRVPVYVGKDNGMQYIDVGTNVDCRATSVEEGRFEVTLDLERSWVEGEVSVPVEKASGQSAEVPVGQFREPVIRQFKSEQVVRMRDGQTFQSPVAADPLTGKSLSVTVTMNIVK